jgi:hypothetical protein
MNLQNSFRPTPAASGRNNCHRRRSGRTSVTSHFLPLRRADDLVRTGRRYELPPDDATTNNCAGAGTIQSTSRLPWHDAGDCRTASSRRGPARTSRRIYPRRNSTHRPTTRRSDCSMPQRAWPTRRRPRSEPCQLEYRSGPVCHSGAVIAVWRLQRRRRSRQTKDVLKEKGKGRTAHARYNPVRPQDIALARKFAQRAMFLRVDAPR